MRGAAWESALPVAAAWLAAVLLAAALGSIVQSQYNLAALRELGVPVPPRLALETTLADLAGFAPRYGLLVGAGFIVALPLAGWLGRRWPGGRGLLYGLAGALAVALIPLTMTALMGISGIAASRFPGAVFWMSAGGALGALLFAALLRRRA